MPLCLWCGNAWVFVSQGWQTQGDLGFGLGRAVIPALCVCAFLPIISALCIAEIPLRLGDWFGAVVALACVRQWSILRPCVCDVSIGQLRCQVVCVINHITAHRPTQLNKIPKARYAKHTATMHSTINSQSNQVMGSPPCADALPHQ